MQSEEKRVWYSSGEKICGVPMRPLSESGKIMSEISLSRNLERMSRTGYNNNEK